MTPRSPARPRILINPELEQGPKARAILPAAYAQAVWAAGGHPLILPPCVEPTEPFVDELLDGADGLLLSGGDDFDTARLGLAPTHEKAKPVPKAKQDFDFHLARRGLERDLPTLGICYGMQLLGLIGGGKLHQHLPEDRPQTRDHTGGRIHSVVLEQGTKLAQLLAVGQSEVISRHHQALASVTSPWIISAYDDEGLIEAIEDPTKRFALGVQWHPELEGPGGLQARLFEGLVTAAQRSAPDPEESLARKEALTP